jgi:hypothetical protein
LVLLILMPRVNRTKNEHLLRYAELSREVPPLQACGECG